MGLRINRRWFAEGLTVATGQIIKYRRSQGGNSHVYFLQCRFATTLGAYVNWQFFYVLNPTTWAMTRAQAQSANLELLPGEKVIYLDTGERFENTENTPWLYSESLEEVKTSGKYISLSFAEGTNNLKYVNLENGFQQQKPEATKRTTTMTIGFYLELLNAPANFEAFVKIQNKTAFDDVRTDYPVTVVVNPKVYMIEPPGVTVTVTYDGTDGNGDYFENDGALGDFFYLGFSRSGGNLTITKYAVNTTP